jgi:hypothetical protein
LESLSFLSYFQFLKKLEEILGGYDRNDSLSFFGWYLLVEDLISKEARDSGVVIG